jgi:gamma-glutamylcyclotransferase (GGCT)/AIG2-like uncharacterized protein YtfP
MALLFSYGSLQEEQVQLSTFGRLLDGEKDELAGVEPASVRIGDPEVAARLGRTHHNNLTFNGKPESRVAGMVFTVTEEELASVDAYEAADSYRRVVATLASGRATWVYVHAEAVPDGRPG